MAEDKINQLSKKIMYNEKIEDLKMMLDELSQEKWDKPMSKDLSDWIDKKYESFIKGNEKESETDALWNKLYVGVLTKASHALKLEKSELYKKLYQGRSTEEAKKLVQIYLIHTKDRY